MSTINKIKNSIAISSLAFSLLLSSKSISTKAKNAYYTFDNDKDSIFKMNLDELEDYIIQGVTYVKDNIVITAYNPNGENTALFIYDKNHNFIKKSSIYNNCHAGGITYDNEHDIVWITDKKGKISGYKSSDILTVDEDITPIFKKIDVSEGLKNIYGQTGCAYVCYYNNKLYLGNFNNKSNSILKCYDINEDGNIDLNSVEEVKFLEATQGITFIEKNGVTYICSSASFGRNIDSTLKIMKYDAKIEDYNNVSSVSLIMPPMMEQICFDDNDILSTVYESNATKYKGKNSTYSDYIEYNVNSIINNTKSL